MNCLLCNARLSEPFFTENSHNFFNCGTCGSYMRDSASFPDKEAEKERYLTHNNDVEDIRYQKFVSPITDAVQHSFKPEDTIGLDFGAGTGPVITKVLSEKGYKLNLYDPFFHPEKTVLSSKYDYIVSCEVIEHFHYPKKEFQLLKELLLPGGKLFCMTDIFSESLDFTKWYYKNDPTHVIFYTAQSLEWIRKEIGFTDLKINKRLIIFEI